MTCSPALWSLLLASLLASGCRLGYVASSSYYQAELLLSRKKNEKVLKKHLLPPAEEKKLTLVPAIKDYGRALGLSSTDNYETTAVYWKRTIWNVSACDPLAFSPVTWWFPVVGRVPYLGYFTDRAASRKRRALNAKGYDAYARTAGAYSTLGWFRDPLLPGMLRWDEDQLSETIFHELAHATLWVKGSVSFNESFADFVGHHSMLLYLAHKFGEGSAELAQAQRQDRDERRLEWLLHNLYKDLDVVYQDASLSTSQKLRKKSELFGSLEERILASDMEEKELYARWIKKSPWNNARLMQFKTYNSNKDDFAALFAAENRDLTRFIDRIKRLTKGKKDPFAALRAEVAALPAPAPETLPASAPASQTGNRTTAPE
jgi:predicted aminopeptidase